MLTYQDFEKIKDDERERPNFALRLINEHKSSADYKTAKEADDYDRRQNTTIMQYRKMLRTISGKLTEDNVSANFKLPSAFFPRFITQQNQYLLGNGVSFAEQTDTIKKKLGKDFDARLQECGRAALVHKVAFGFWNYDHLEVFKFPEFAPLLDEDTGALRAGVRFWHLADNKPLRFTIYEVDGYQEYARNGDEDIVALSEKKAYITTARGDKRDKEENTQIIDGKNYPNFPIVPLWGNPQRQSELIGIREAIDCYDLIKSGFANDLDEASSFYWIIKNAGGMDDMDLVQFIERIKTVKATAIDSEGGAAAEAHTMNIPYEARRVALEQIKADLYDDFQIVNVALLSAGSRTATEINAAYQPMDNKVDQYEYCVLDFLDSIMQLAGVEGTPTFNRSKIVNQLEQTQMVLMAANFLDEEAVLNHIPWLTREETQEILERKAEADIQRFMAEVGPSPMEPLKKEPTEIEE